jgi:hypothetical protein
MGVDAMKIFTVVFYILVLFALLADLPVLHAQITVPGQYIVPLRYCQLSATNLSSAVGLGEGTCVTFTGTGSGTNLTVTGVSGKILAGDAISGTGVTSGTTIVSQTSGTPGGAGVYVTSMATTSSGATISGGSIPPGATMAYLQAESANVRYRDDGTVPTASIGNLILSTTSGIFYAGTLSNVEVIAAAGSPILDVAFYRQ